MGKTDNKKPKISSSIQPESLGLKVPKHVRLDDGYDVFHPAWYFNLCDRNGQHCWANAHGDDAGAILTRLGELGRMTWSEILRDGKKQNHGVSPQDIIPAARSRLTSLKLDDHDTVYCAHVTGEKRIWFLKHNDRAFLLWWDPKHEIYPSKKKHT